MSGFRIRKLENSLLWSVSAGYYSPKLNQAARTVPGMRFDSKLKAHVGYVDAVEQLVARLRELGLKTDDPPPNERKWPHNLLVSYDGAREYQKEGIDFLINQAGSGALLASEMGVGKSLMIARAARALRRKTVIVCPAHVRGVWERPANLTDKGGELAKWWPKAKVFTSYGLKPSPIPADTDVFMTHYDIVYAWVDVVLEWAAGDFTLVCDEAHVLLSETSRRSKACRALAESARGRIAATGTPPTDRVKDLFNIVDTISPGRFGEFFPFGVRYCCTPEAPIWMGDMSFKPIGEIRPGDEVIGWDQGATGENSIGKSHTGAKYRKLVRARVLAVSRRRAETVKITFASGRTVRCTPDHVWLTGNYAKAQAWTKARVGRYLGHVIEPSRELSLSEARAASWLGGIFDGEGHVSDVSKRARGGGRNITITQSEKKNADVCAEIERVLSALGFAYAVYTRKDGVRQHTFGGRQTLTDFLNWCRPVRRERIEQCVLGAKFRSPDRVLSITPNGINEVVSVATSTGNYVVWGYASKNCDAHKIDVPGPENTVKSVWSFDGRSNMPELRQRLDRFALRHTKREVLKELPALQRQIVDVQVPPKHRISMNARLVGDRKQMRMALDSAADGKFKSVLALISGHLEEGMRVVVGTYRRAVCEKFADLLSEVAPTKFIHGGIPITRRGKIIDDLRKTEGACCLVANIDCVSTGIDLTFASVVVMAELVWEPRDLVQFESRVHRFGAEESVLVQYVIARGTGDELIMQAVINKLDNFLDLVETDAGDGLKEALVGKKDEGLLRLAAALKKMGAKEGRLVKNVESK